MKSLVFKTSEAFAHIRVLCTFVLIMASGDFCYSQQWLHNYLRSPEKEVAQKLQQHDLKFSDLSRYFCSYGGRSKEIFVAVKKGKLIFFEGTGITFKGVGLGKEGSMSDYWKVKVSDEAIFTHLFDIPIASIKSIKVVDESIIVTDFWATVYVGLPIGKWKERYSVVISWSYGNVKFLFDTFNTHNRADAFEEELLDMTSNN